MTDTPTGSTLKTKSSIFALSNRILAAVLFTKALGYSWLAFYNPYNWFVFKITGGGTLATATLLLCMFHLVSKNDVRLRSVILLCMITDLVIVATDAMNLMANKGVGQMWLVFGCMIWTLIWATKEVRNDTD